MPGSTTTTSDAPVEQALCKHTLLVKVHLPCCIGGCSRNHIAHASILAGDDVDHIDAFTQLVDGPIEFVGLAENLFRARKHEANDEASFPSNSLTERAHRVASNQRRGFWCYPKYRIGAEIRLVKDRREG